MEMDGRIDGGEDDDTADGEASTGGHNMVHTTHAHSLSSSCSYVPIFAKGCENF